MNDRKADVKSNRLKANRPKSERRRIPGALSPRRANEIHKKIESAFERFKANCSSQTNFRSSLLASSVDTKYSGADFMSTRGNYVAPKERASLAIQKWRKAEYRNEKTNNRLMFTNAYFNIGGREVSSAAILAQARRFILETIGRTPPQVKQSVFTNGASTRVKRDGYAAATKFQGSPHTTPEAFIPFCTVLQEGGLMRWAEWNEELLAHPCFVRGSEMFTVPKNALIDRVACKEPEINMYMQRAYGDFIRRKLKRRGVDLNDQTVNQQLARVGSEMAGNGHRRKSLVTIDLSSASDTISTILVKLLLPEEWFQALDEVRVKETLLVSGEWHRLHMFSSMGNGFTFEVESLLFWALTRSVAYHGRHKGRISVFGDDIICPHDTGRTLTRVFPWFGFSLNEAKSCFGTELRESCGAWWSCGRDVTPFYYREKITHVTDVIRLANQLMHWLCKRSWHEAIDPVLMELWYLLAKQVPEKLHGGQSFERDDALVTGHAPRSVIGRVLSKRQRAQIRNKAPEIGAYIQWHHDKCGEYFNPMFVPRTFTAKELARVQDVTAPTEPTLSERTGIWVYRPNQSEYSVDLRDLILCAHMLYRQHVACCAEDTPISSQVFNTVIQNDGEVTQVLIRIDWRTLITSEQVS